MTELELKRKYNATLKKYNKIEDGTAAIVKVPIFKRINETLEKTATEIARLHGVTGDRYDVMDHFKNGELYKGFDIQ